MNLKEKSVKTSHSERLTDMEDKGHLEDYPQYPECDDIYCKCRKEDDVNPEDISKCKERNPKKKSGKSNENDFADDMSGGDLDVPGSELDDDLENVGSEDEENNYYSLGGDGHSDLDEDDVNY
jgi:hypothetical protein